MNEFIVRETGYPGAVKQEIVGELVRCKDCKYQLRGNFISVPFCEKLSEKPLLSCKNLFHAEDDWFCAYGERRADNGS